MTRTNAVTVATANIARAERTLTEAQDALDQARDQLDQALAERGWRRFHAIADARLYTHAGNPGNPVPLAQVLEAVSFQEAAA